MCTDNIEARLICARDTGYAVCRHDHEKPVMVNVDLIKEVGAMSRHKHLGVCCRFP